MGTRHLIAVYVDGKHKVAQYGQWDGYPSGQGTTALNFLRSLDTLDKVDAFREKVRATVFAADEEIQAKWKEVGADDSGWVGIEVSEKFAKRYPQLSRDTGAAVLGIINDSEPGIVLKDSLDFVTDGLFCEWAYVVDLDANVFEVYEGLSASKGETKGRFSSLTPAADNNGYGVVTLVKSYPLSALPTEKEFLADLEPQEEEQEA